MLQWSEIVDAFDRASKEWVTIDNKARQALRIAVTNALTYVNVPSDRTSLKNGIIYPDTISYDKAEGTWSVAFGISLPGISAPTVRICISAESAGREFAFHVNGSRLQVPEGEHIDMAIAASIGDELMRVAGDPMNRRELTRVSDTLSVLSL